MSTIKLKFRPSIQKEKKGSLYFQVIHQRTIRQVSLGCKLFQNEWDADEGTVILPESDSERYSYLLTLQKRIPQEKERLLKQLRRIELTKGTQFDVDQMLRTYRVSLHNNGMLHFARQLIYSLRNSGRARTAETYQSTLNSFLRFYQKADDIPMEEFTPELIIRYQGYLKSEGLTPNSISFYMRNLRAIYNQAIDKGLCLPQTPFKHVYTGIAKTVKRALPLNTLRKIRDIDLTYSPNMDYARDIFMFSFYTRGMSFIDMAFLKKKDLQNGILIYRRHKTGQQLYIKWEKPMQDIIEKYDTEDTPYLLPIIKNINCSERQQYLSAVHLINRKLKKLGEILELPAPLTTYVAHHAWASIAKSKNISVSVISEAMGHDSERTTRIYLASLDTSSVDKANKLILTSLL